MTSFTSDWLSVGSQPRQSSRRKGSCEMKYTICQEENVSPEYKLKAYSISHVVEWLFE